MKLFLVSYDLRVPGRNYDLLISEIKNALAWWHYLDSTWIIRTTRSLGDWNDRLLPKIDKNDSLLIVDITNCPRQGWLPKKAWDWIREQNTLVNSTPGSDVGKQAKS